MVYSLIMQLDCNLVLYFKKNKIWDTKTNGKGINCFLRMQKDGNLVLYDKNYMVIWSYNLYWKNIWVTFSLCVVNEGYIIVYDTKTQKSIWKSKRN
ncbi:hypothetical protein SELMODRAFT_121889 [Selaginella moellendorffii]|uniref:Bulb-type lectin domain-containing protein n=1 Tax=Selaginella moellendorffii TaxID=88036 RepID=D8SPG9_SELML|nr:hypothetical protein SELMODRAFT_121889 [Selaginella moellendorffii]